MYACFCFCFCLCYFCLCNIAACQAYIVHLGVSSILYVIFSKSGQTLHEMAHHLELSFELSHQVLHVFVDICTNLFKLNTAHHDFCHLLSHLLMYLGNLYR